TRRPVAPNSDATLYEVSETVHFDSAAGLSVTMRDAIATLLGSANLGTPLCPAAVLAMNPAATSCDIAGQGQDSVSLATGLGPGWGTFAVLINAPGNSDDHIPDLPVLTGTFTGDVDLSPAVQSQIPLGYLRNGQLTVDQTGQVISFSGTFRLPFSQVDAMGLKRDYYLAADGTPIPVRQHERDLGFPLVRLGDPVGHQRPPVEEFCSGRYLPACNSNCAVMLMPDINQVISDWGYAGIFLVVILGNIGLPVPEETVLAVAGYLVWSGRLQLLPVLIVGLV